MIRQRLITGLLSLLLTFAAQARVEVLEFKTPEHEERYNNLIAELRCLVCQNQNLADSNAELAVDLRRKTYQMVSKNKSEKEIAAYMVERYGDFVLYRPPVKGNTLLLWLAPALLLAGGAMVVWFNVRQRKRLLTEAGGDETG